MSLLWPNTSWSAHQVTSYANFSFHRIYFLNYCFVSDREKDMKRNSLAKAYRNLIHTMWGVDHPPSYIAPTSVLHAVKLVCNLTNWLDYVWLTFFLNRFFKCFEDSSSMTRKSFCDVLWTSFMKNSKVIFLSHKLSFTRFCYLSSYFFSIPRTIVWYETGFRKKRFWWRIGSFGLGVVFDMRLWC